jgi:membrane carboxypeptidase/penicillin-binding protein PbpC
MKYPRLRASCNYLQQLIDRFMQQRSEPQISEHRDRQGNLYYQVYDVLTAKLITFGSEMEIKWWLEQRYRN